MHSSHQKYYAKLAHRYYGPFQIQERINETAYRLRLPASWHIHNAFHVSLLKPFKGTPLMEPLEEEPPLNLMNLKSFCNRKLFYDMRIRSYEMVRYYVSI